MNLRSFKNKHFGCIYDIWNTAGTQNTCYAMSFLAEQLITDDSKQNLILRNTILLKALIHVFSYLAL